MTPAQLKRLWPKGSQPPSGYIAKHDWADAQLLHGLKQTQCGGCGLWLFPQQVKEHECKR